MKDVPTSGTFYWFWFCFCYVFDFSEKVLISLHFQSFHFLAARGRVRKEIFQVSANFDILICCSVVTG